MGKHRGQFAEVDLFLAIFILVLGLIIITAPFIHVREDIQADRLSYDAVNMLSSLKLKDLDYSFQNEIISRFDTFGISYSYEDNLIGLITKLFVKYKETDDEAILDFASHLANNVLRDVIPSRYLFEVYVQSGGEMYDIISIDEYQQTDIASQSRTLLTGLEVGRPITGFVSSGFIREARKVDSAYYFIGGFIGQGDLSFTMNINSDEINDFYVEGMFYDDFSLYVNNIACANSVQAGFVNQNFASCVSYFNQGFNTINISFLGDDLTNKHISGGNIRVDYNVSDSLSQTSVSGRKYISGVDGVINIYDSFYVPGRLKNINFRLNHDINITLNISEEQPFNEAKLIMTIANQTVYKTYKKGPHVQFEQNVDIGDYFEATIPFRIGFEEFSTIIEGSSAVDIVLVTDLSNSMWFSSDNHIRQGNMINVDGFDYDICGWTGDEEWFRTYGGTDSEYMGTYVQRIAMAICATNLLIEELFSEDKDIRVAILGFGGASGGSDIYYTAVRVEDIFNFSSNKDDLIAFSESTYSKNRGNTCISCGIAAGINLFSQTPPDRDKVMIVMTDGVQNRKYDEDFLPPEPTIFRDYDDVSGNDEVHTNSFSDFVKDELDSIIYSINFAAPPGAKNLLQDIASPNETVDGELRTYYLEGDDPLSILDIYQSIAEQISISTGYVSQVINVTLDDFDVFESRLFTDSFIEYEFVPYELPALAGTIKVTLEQPFNTDSCSQLFSWNYDEYIKLGRGFLTSYSGNIWTSRASINNNPVFDIFSYSGVLGEVGDPFVLGFSHSILNNLENSVRIELHDGDNIQSICDSNNKLIYDIHFPAFFSSDGVREKSEGCVWAVVGVGSLSIPGDYSGHNPCSYDPIFKVSNFDSDDALQVLGFNILKGLTYNDELIIDLQKSDIDVSILQVDDVPYLWGPALLGVTIWR